MRKLIPLLLISFAAIASCNSSKKNVDSNYNKEHQQEGDTVRIANEESDYEIIIIEPGFNNWMRGRVRPRGYYSQQFLENRNIVYVTEWNNRVLNNQQYGSQLYLWQIDYNPQIDYGYEVNYLLYYYFIYFQQTYDQRLAGWVPRI
ncbi:MAG: DUF6146 family protein [bacterium]